MAGSQMIVVGLALAATVIQARLIPPQVLGYYSSFAILGTYLSFLHLGSLTALGREYPYWLGKGSPQRAWDAASVVQGWMLFAGAMVVLGYLALIVRSLFMSDPRAVAAWGSQMIFLSLSFYVLYLGCTYRSTNDFVKLSKNTVITSAVSFACLPLVAFFHFWGLCLRVTIPSLVNASLLHRNRPLRVAPRLAARPLWDMVKFGLPVDLSIFLGSACVSATMGWLVYRAYGEVVLGLFTFARTAESAVQQFAISLVQVFIPRINHRMGLNEDLRDCTIYASKLMLLGTVAVLGVCVLAVFACGPLVRRVTPNYLAAVPIMQILICAGATPILGVPAHALIAAKKTAPIIVGNVVGFTAFAAVAGFCFSMKIPSIAIAWAYLISRFAQVLIVLGFLANDVIRGVRIRVCDAPPAGIFP